MRVLLLVLQFPPDVNSNGRLLAQIGQGLVERGHDVSVVTSFPHYAQFRVWPEYRGKLLERERYAGMDVLRLWIYASGRKYRMVDRFLSYFSFSLAATIAGLAARKRYDVILCPNGGFLTGISAAIVSQLTGAPTVLNLQDLYPETPIQTGQIRSARVIRILRLLERYMYAKSAHISVITPHFRNYVVRMGMRSDAVSVVPNFVDTDFIRPLPRDNPFSRRLELSEKFVVTHAGNIGYAYDLETLIEAAALLRDRPDIVYLIVGEGVVKARLEQRVRELGLTRVRFLPYQPAEDLPWLRASSDVQVALTRAGGSAHSMPSKVYEIMASGRPVLASADRDSDLWNLVQQTGCGLCVEPQDARGLADALVDLRERPGLRAEMGRLGRRRAEQAYSKSVVVDQYEQLLQRTRRMSPAVLKRTSELVH